MSYDYWVYCPIQYKTINSSSSIFTKKMLTVNFIQLDTFQLQHMEMGSVTKGGSIKLAVGAKLQQLKTNHYFSSIL